ncbi:MAG TPA: hypothetical protein VJO32_02945 [Ktedonobacteraceae bacterium]|nr:hypothetical protein [Ktedonobacteraceae bacterium]
MLKKRLLSLPYKSGSWLRWIRHWWGSRQKADRGHPYHRALSPVFVFIVVAVFVVLMLLFCGLLFGGMYIKARQNLTVTETA